MEYKKVEDSELMLAIQKGDLDALEELYDRHHRIALAVADRVLGDSNLAEDVIQEAFLAVWRQAMMFRSDSGTAKTWLLSIVRHRAIDITRKRSFTRERLSLDEMVFVPRYLDPWKDVSRNLDREQVRQAIDTLPNEQKETVMLAYYGGYTLREISDRTDAPLGTVKGRMRLALQKLRTFLAEPDIGKSH